MVATENKPRKTLSMRVGPPPLENGLALDAREFLRRYKAMPEVKKAELVEGKVYMGSPVRADVHAIPDGLTQTWLGTYAAVTPGVVLCPNTTLLLDRDNTYQPDAILCVDPKRGGRTRLNAEGYLVGPPELVVEIAASSAALDAREKFRVYRRAGVLEYLLWRTEDESLEWFILESDEYIPLVADDQGVLRSRAFPGLALLRPAMLALDAATVLKVLNEAIKSPEHAKFVKRLAAQAKSK